LASILTRAHVLHFLHADAILGTKKQVATVDGDVEVEVGAGTQPNTRITLKGKGVPMLGQPSVRGDQVGVLV
jgi:molecular chaperone DnaJ